MELKNKKVWVVGMGVTGRAACEFFSNNGASVIATDSKPVVDNIPPNIDVRCGWGTEELPDTDIDLILVSPGVDTDTGSLRTARKKNIPIMNDIEVGLSYPHPPVIAVTGTNGKTTTVSLISVILETGGFRTWVGGNIGTPLTAGLDDIKNSDYMVIEVSSYQLETMNDFRPFIAILLNVTDDHLKRHKTFKNYLKIKKRIFSDQTPDDYAILNISNPAVNRITREEIPSNILRVNIKNKTHIQLSGNGVDWSDWITVEGSSLRGIKNVENIACAATAASICEVPEESIISAIKKFKPLPHRLQSVCSINGIEFINDSKSTNVDSTVCAIEAIQEPMYLILGGRDKGGDWSPINKSIKKHGNIRKIFAVGEAKHIIQNELSEIVSVETVHSIDAAVKKAYAVAEAGTCVLLSPACSSFDQFTNYEDRGNAFIENVKKLEQQ